MKELRIPYGENQVRTFDLDTYLPCKSEEWHVLISIFKTSKNEVEIYENLIPYLKSRIDQLTVVRDTLTSNMKPGNFKVSKEKIKHAQAQINWFERNVKELERLFQTAQR